MNEKVAGDRIDVRVDLLNSAVEQIQMTYAQNIAVDGMRFWRLMHEMCTPDRAYACAVIRLQTFFLRRGVENYEKIHRFKFC